MGLIALFILFILLASVIGGVVLMIAGISRRKRAVHGSGTCATCGYSVRQLTGWECPECGADLREMGINGYSNQVRGGKAMILIGALLLLLPLGCIGSGFMFAYQATAPVAVPTAIPSPTSPSTPPTTTITTPTPQNP